MLWSSNRASPGAERGLPKSQLSTLSAFLFETPLADRLICFSGKVQRMRFAWSQQSFKSRAFAVVRGAVIFQWLKVYLQNSLLEIMVLVLWLAAAGGGVSCKPSGARGVLLVYTHHNTARDQASAHSVKQTDNSYQIDTASLEQIRRGIYLNWELKEAIKTFPLVFLFCLLMRPGSCPSDSHRVHIWRTLHSLAYLHLGKF